MKKFKIPLEPLNGATPQQVNVVKELAGAIHDAGGLANLAKQFAPNGENNKNSTYLSGLMYGALNGSLGSAWYNNSLNPSAGLGSASDYFGDYESPFPAPSTAAASQGEKDSPWAMMALGLVARDPKTAFRGADVLVMNKGWKLGDDVYNLTTKGNQPSWTTVRTRFWKNESATPGAADKYGAENLEQMAQGKAPQRYNADKGSLESMELSHEPIPFRNGGKDFVPRWPQDHAAIDPFRRPGY